ncbi:ABC transporter ATP-binding protein [Bordetella bronchialis]|uniref:Fe3+/spermidine/putrescine ABC transporter ATP-binding protein n=1 Tax=Bordetella bronchialis TaxID=463025 RepID=A0ABN4QVW4_9BORD|nr:ABC transporter ATP-binding protein [Bordetella bronchialis]ANN65128.1 Fe3+/spermidine/putrescine ABC transporter ATP-binding protein [Bordetella bronchialis]
MAKVSLENLHKQFGASVAVADFSLEIADGELVAFLGPSGCGKTTTLRMIAGFLAPSAGSIRIGGKDVTDLPVHKRDTGMVFQRYALFPHMTVAQNVAFGLEMHKVPGAERDARIRDVLDMVRMAALRDRYPRQLSGGQQQRVAIARALAIQPKVFLLDEPLSNLDAKLRVEVREEIRALQQRLGLTTVFVTHDQEEALAMADRMAIMHDGKVQQVGTPEALYEKPANLFVADFLGKMNFFRGGLADGGVFGTEKGTRIRVQGGPAGARHVGVRPERVRLSAEAGGGNALPGVVESTVYLGSLLEVRVRLESGETILSQLPNGANGANDAVASDRRGAPTQAGTRVWACFEPVDCVMFAE